MKYNGHTDYKLGRPNSSWAEWPSRAMWVLHPWAIDEGQLHPGLQLGQDGGGGCSKRKLSLWMLCFCVFLCLYSCYNIICAKGETKLFVNGEYIHIYIHTYIYIYKQTSVSLSHQEASIRRRKWQSTLIFLLEKSHGQRSLLGCSLRGHKRNGHDWASKQQTMHHLELAIWGRFFE